MDFNKNYYDILGVNENATEEEIKKSFRKKANQYHPDKKSGSEDKFKEINEAYSVLSKNRSKYDNTKKFKNSQFSDGFSNFENFGFNFDDIFNAFNNRYTKKTYYEENLDLSYNIIITLKDVYNNTSKKITYNRKEVCQDCQGTGQNIKSGIQDSCKYCLSGKDEYGLPCIICGGTGKIYNDVCSTCKGDKLVNKEIIFTLNNTYKINKTTSKYLKGYGNYSKYYPGKVGMLILNIKYQFDHSYRITEKGLTKKLDVHFQDAIDGNPLIFDHLDRGKIKINIPKQTKDGDLVRITKKGLLTDSTNRNDLIFEINIIIDYNKIFNIK